MLFIVAAKIFNYSIIRVVHVGSFSPVSWQHKKSVILLHPLIEVFGIPWESNG